MTELLTIYDATFGPGFPRRPRRIERDGGLIWDRNAPADFDSGAAVFTDVPGSLVDTLNGDYAAWTVEALVATVRTQILGSNDGVTFVIVSVSITTLVGTPDTHLLPREEASMRFFKVQERRNAAGTPATARIRGFFKGPG